jgi:hypothetical protein
VTAAAAAAGAVAAVCPAVVSRQCRCGCGAAVGAAGDQRDGGGGNAPWRAGLPGQRCQRRRGPAIVARRTANTSAGFNAPIPRSNEHVLTMLWRLIYGCCRVRYSAHMLYTNCGLSALYRNHVYLYCAVQRSHDVGVAARQATAAAHVDVPHCWQRRQRPETA